MSQSCAIVLHGSGSSPEFIQRAFGPAAADADLELIAPDASSCHLPELLDVIGALCRTRPVSVLAGVSLGAHAAAAHAAATGWDGRLALVMPAWSGPPSEVAALTRVTADRIEAEGLEAVLSQLEADVPHDWVVAELARAWRTYPPGRLVASLRAASRQQSPEPQQLRDVRAATRLIALDEDPTHPVAVARRWQAAIPGATLTVLPRDLAGGEVRRLGDAALSGFR